MVHIVLLIPSLSCAGAIGVDYKQCESTTKSPATIPTIVRSPCSHWDSCFAVTKHPLMGSTKPKRNAHKKTVRCVVSSPPKKAAHKTHKNILFRPEKQGQYASSSSHTSNSAPDAFGMPNLEELDDEEDSERLVRDMEARYEREYGSFLGPEPSLPSETYHHQIPKKPEKTRQTVRLFLIWWWSRLNFALFSLATSSSRMEIIPSRLCWQILGARWAWIVWWAPAVRMRPTQRRHQVSRLLRLTPAVC